MDNKVEKYQRIVTKRSKGSKLGRPFKDRPDRESLERLYIREKKPIREVAEILDCSKDIVHRALEEFGIDRRPHTRKSKLEQFDLEFLKEKVKEKGYRLAAQDLDVDRRTLERYLKKR